jgi:hypothetical protein
MCSACVIIGWALILGIIIFFFGLCKYSNILRDSVDPTILLQAAQDPKYKNKYANKTADQIPRPFSLSRVQFCVWTIIISCSYIFLVLCKCCDMTTVVINSTALILMGISAGTTLLAGTIDQSQVSSDRHQNAPSEGFLTDILSDENGISIHRFQNVIWTVIAICVYLCYLNASGCHLPVLDNTLLALTGISATAYVAVKQGENKP